MEYWGTIPSIIGKASQTRKLSHAYLLTGPEGIGKKTLAMEFAARIFCEGDNKPCGECKHCRMFSAGSHPDFITVHREKDKANLSIRLIREMIDDVYIKPLLSSYKVILIPEADKMEFPAQNALLKVFEEPPSYCVILLIAKNEQSLLPTVRSRAVTVQVPHLGEKVIEQKIKERYPDFAEDASFLAAFSGGIPGRALAMCENASFLEMRGQWLDALFALAQGKKSAVFTLAEQYEKNKDRQDILLELMLCWLKDALFVSREYEDGLINQDRMQELETVAGSIPEKNLATAFTFLAEERRKMGKNPNIRLWITDVILRMREVLHDESNRNMF